MGSLKGCLKIVLFNTTKLATEVFNRIVAEILISNIGGSHLERTRGFLKFLDTVRHAPLLFRTIFLLIP